MRRQPEQIPSWLSTVVIALLALVILGITGGIYGAAYQVAFAPTFVDFDSPPRGENVPWWCGLAAGLVSAATAAWGWRTSQGRRFHIAYLSGLVLIITAFSHLWMYRKAFPFPAELLPDWHVVQVLLLGPIVAWFTATLGLVLILTALIQDRRT
ncbi:MAG: hypothetical protein ABJF10_10335 [Chthoniobacter sp.]|uniref:hypothetical protein n=1 Tax=Chthoniobacter sp. TaxID=2510640 RepID=UPI0032A6D829